MVDGKDDFHLVNCCRIEHNFFYHWLYRHGVLEFEIRMKQKQKTFPSSELLQNRTQFFYHWLYRHGVLEFEIRTKQKKKNNMSYVYFVGTE